MDHHFLPRFYLSRWAANGKVWEYKLRRNGMLEGKERAPKGTGYEIDLYKVEAKEGEAAHAFELKFLQQHDDLASRALTKLETTGNPSDDEMRGWISFLIAMNMRHPDDIKMLRAEYARRWRNEFGSLQDQYAVLKGDNNPDHICDFIEKHDPGRMETQMFDVLAGLMAHDKIGQLILDYEHSVTTLNSTLEMFTADRPVLMSPTLTEDNAYIIMPVGPKKLYLAAKDKTTQRLILNKSGNDMVKTVNDQVIKHSNIAAYSTQQGNERYINKRLGTKVYESWFTRLANFADNTKNKGLFHLSGSARM